MPASPRMPLVQAALNGVTTRDTHPAAPMTPDDFVRDAAAVAAAGAGAIHLHPRDPEGRETLDPTIVNDLVARVKAASGLPAGVSTGAWIEPDIARRLACIRAWTAPDYASVNLSEADALQTMDALLTAGVSIEAGLATAEDVELLAASGYADRVTHILVEPFDEDHDGDVAAILSTAHAIHAALDHHGITAPRLQHGNGPAAWPLLRDAIARGLDTRIGLEDTVVADDGTPATSNATLIAAAISPGSFRATG
ncbi:MAG: 3-keto-5-aminohexanoate cleavage protein [Thermomicrobiales bacterium]